MTRPQTMPNERQDVRIRVENVLPLSECCPVSKNPRPGSTITIRYRPGPKVLEVYSLKEYIDGFIDGHEDGTRNMEAMIQKIAQDCADVLEVRVYVFASLVIDPNQQIRLSVTAEPCDSTLALINRHGSDR